MTPRLAPSLAFVAVLAGSGALAQVSSEGHFYATGCNASGFVLTSDHPVGRFFGGGAATTLTTDREVIYLGRSCDAARTGWTDGTWCWANGGVRVTFAEYGIAFPRQELSCPTTGPRIDLTDIACGCQ